ncbi:protein LTO1 homolog isoform X2 [Antechinus flavipes]|uniref:protein LTO1 homolog isoform X2 n=1 Tax=Antechinus flavipes TaxID=38775 RepID=UPI00223616DC|nr:protein LTO1 homolog isoform X2 [Antechinus flavipes]
MDRPPDLFDAIVMAEERYRGEGFQEGYAEGRCLGLAEGRRAGVVRGASIGSEIGSYRGFALTWKCLLSESTTDKDRKKAKMLDSLLGMVQRFPYADPTHGQLHEDLDRIRGKFKQVCSLLSVQPDFHVSPGGSALSF